MTYRYKDFEIEVNEICDPKFGNGYRAEFSIPTRNGRKFAQRYDTYERGIVPMEMVTRVTRIIDAFNY